jgi:hypothetical protein
VAGWGEPTFADVLLERLPPKCCLQPLLPCTVTTVNMPNDSTNPQESEIDISEAAEALAETRQRLAEIPAEVVVVNHVMGLYELAAIHLSAQPPRLFEAALAIDAVACLVEGLEGRLGDEEATLKLALDNIRIAFVQIKDAMLKEEEETA